MHEYTHWKLFTATAHLFFIIKYIRFWDNVLHKVFTQKLHTFLDYLLHTKVSKSFTYILCVYPYLMIQRMNIIWVKKAVQFKNEYLYVFMCVYVYTMAFRLEYCLREFIQLVWNCKVIQHQRTWILLIWMN